MTRTAVEPGSVGIGAADEPKGPTGEAEGTVVADEFLAAALVHDQHGPSYWRKLTDAGREMYVRRFAEAVHRADDARKQAAPATPAGSK